MLGIPLDSRLANILRASGLIYDMDHLDLYELIKY